MAKKASKKVDDVNKSPYAKRLFSRKFTSSFIDAILDIFPIKSLKSSYLRFNDLIGKISSRSVKIA